VTLDQRRKTLATAIVTIITSLVLTIAIGAAYTTAQINRTNARADREIELSNQRWCTLFEDITRPRPVPPINPAAPPTSDFGKALLKYNQQTETANRKFVAELLDLARAAKCGFVR
jgi:hypothetical protein